MINVTTAPAAAPCSRRVSESPRRIAGISMTFPLSPEISRREYNGCPNGLRSMLSSWIEGPAALSWRFGRADDALNGRQSRWSREDIKSISRLWPCAGLSRVAPGTTKVEAANAQPAAQQNQGDPKPSTEKPTSPQQK